MIQCITRIKFHNFYLPSKKSAPLPEKLCYKVPLDPIKRYRRNSTKQATPVPYIVLSHCHFKSFVNTPHSTTFILWQIVFSTRNNIICTFCSCFEMKAAKMRLCWPRYYQTIDTGIKGTGR